MVWRRPLLLHYAAWLQQLREQAVLQGCVERVLIAPEQARWLWQQVIDKDVFVGEPKVAELAASAWQRLHDYRLADPEQWPKLELSDDAAAFRHWVWQFRRRCDDRGYIDPVTLDARLPEYIAAGRLQLPQRIELIGFELPLTPLQQAILNAAAATGTELIADASTPAGTVTERASSASMPDGSGAAKPDTRPDTRPDAMIALRQAGQNLQVQRFVDADAELLAAANWARLQLEAKPDQTIAIVVPDLNGRIDQVDTVFRQVFAAPAFALQSESQQCWHISLGQRLQQWPLVSDALLLLGLDPARIDQPRIGRVLRSPFVRAWPEEAAQRAASLAAMLRDASYELTGKQWLQQVQQYGNQHLVVCLQNWLQQLAQQPVQALPSGWAAQFQQQLHAFGFADGRKLDSREFQLLQRWHELLEAFSAMDVVTLGPIRRAEALALLNECASHSTFRERNPGCPVEILGVAEALGSRFDALWITTLDADTWPPPARREALLPGPVQAHIPTANSAGCLRLAALQLRGLLRSAPQLRGSLANTRESEQAELTALLMDAAMVDVEAVSDTIEVALEVLTEDVMAPALLLDSGNNQMPGGTGIIRDQSACPFRAFAVHRLYARELRPPRPGLNAMDRGNLLHKALELFWRHLPDQAAFKALDGASLTQRIQRAATNALQKLLQKHPLLLSQVGHDLEQQCLQRALGRWLALEREREPFSVTALEQLTAIELAGLRINVKIDRIDKTDLGEMLIDYKSGKVNKADWYPEPRIADPQLPLYALAMQTPPQAIAFASLAPDQMRFDGLANGTSNIPGVADLATAKGKFKAVTDWSALLQDWQEHLQTLAADFLAGKAQVHPRQASVCQYCHLHALCRIHEREPFMEAQEVTAE